MERPADRPIRGVLNLNKPPGMTSRDAVNRPIRVRMRTSTSPPQPRASPTSRAIERMYVPLPHSISSSNRGQAYPRTSIRSILTERGAKSTTAPARARS